MEFGDSGVTSNDRKLVFDVPSGSGNATGAVELNRNVPQFDRRRVAGGARVLQQKNRAAILTLGQKVAAWARERQR